MSNIGVKSSLFAILNRPVFLLYTLTYGYEISRQLEEYGFGSIAEGTIYPLLLRLEKNELVTAVYRQSELGPKRKYYSLTDKGITELRQFAENYRELSAAVERLFHDVEGDMR